MSMPKSIVKIKKGEVTYISNVDAVKYSIRELTRGALRDVGKYMRSKYKEYFYNFTKKHSGLAGGALQYWVRSKECDLQLGLWKTRKPSKGFWGGFYEIGSTEHKIPKYNIMYNMVEQEKAKIIEIESKYLSALNGEASHISRLIDEKEIDNE